MRHTLLLFTLLVVGSGSLWACSPGVPLAHDAVSQIPPIKGRVMDMPASRSAQATLGEVANAATVSLIDAGTGNTVSSSLTDASGSFVLTFNNFTPVAGTPYVLEAVKGLSAGGTANRVGASAARLRTLLFWNNGWQSLTNGTPGTGIVVSAATTAIATISSLKQLSVPTMLQLVNSVSGSSFTDGKGGLSSASDFQPVLTLVSNAMALDQDPVGQIAYDASSGAYSLPTGVPGVASITPAIGTPGQTLTVHGSYFDPNPGRLSFWFGSTPVSTYSVSADRTSVTVTIPGSAVSAPFTMQQPNGVVETLSPFYMLHGTVGTYAGNGNAAFADGTGINAEFHTPYGLAFDAYRNLFIGDYQNYRIREISPAGAVTTPAGGTAGYSDGTGAAARFNAAIGLAFDGSGNLVIADCYNHKIRKMTPSGVVSTLAGSSAGFADGTGAAAQFNEPYGVAIDASGSIYVADAFNHRIRVVSPTGVVTTLAGNGTAASLDGTGTSAEFNEPEGIAVDGNGNLYVAEYTTSRIRKVVISTGVVTTLAGSTSGYTDGISTASQFVHPYGMAADGSGNLYVADSGNNRIRKIVIATGAVTTLAGNGIAGYADSTLANSSFNLPVSVVIDPAGNLYTSDWGGHRVRVITP